ncbi:hypothetical protein CGZ93_02115 [Enemella dayhoffiae]|uniref:DUF4352 domain-containing protein n=1 Tax=Enemella dayhoffiae TaxID=2016507 RepID=A0A255HC10_9ACTN|nr:hypothetical protein [Enemella dayhoffiae]OYO25261.1 hypothetical protein CGZ93_02115 [Enemella dayhoffiae]
MNEGARHLPARRLIQVALTASCLSLTLLTGCGKPPVASTATTPPPAQSPAAQAPRGPGAESTPHEPGPLDPPTEPPEGDKFTFDQAARYSDGVLVEVSTITRAKATPQQHGAEGTEGSIAVAEILITNQSNKPYDTAPIKVWGYYGDVGAPKILDDSKKLGDSFRGVVQPGGQARATMGFAIPSEAMNDVTIMIDAGAPDKSAVQFSGPVP